MSQDIVNEVCFLLNSILMGVIITFVYDFLLIGRRVIRHNLFFISMEDFVFWVACAIIVFYMLYEENNGILRWFAVGGAALGMLVYKRLVGKHFVKLVSTFISKEIHLIRKVLGILLKPLRFLGGKIRKTSGRVLRKEKKLGKYMKKKLTGFIKMLKISISKH